MREWGPRRDPSHHFFFFLPNKRTKRGWVNIVGLTPFVDSHLTNFWSHIYVSTSVFHHQTLGHKKGAYHLRFSRSSVQPEAADVAVGWLERPWVCRVCGRPGPVRCMWAIPARWGRGLKRWNRKMDRTIVVILNMKLKKVVIKNEWSSLNSSKEMNILHCGLSFGVSPDPDPYFLNIFYAKKKERKQINNSMDNVCRSRWSGLPANFCWRSSRRVASGFWSWNVGIFNSTAVESVETLFLF